jgi:hypothetical protein
MFFEGKDRIYMAGQAWLMDDARTDIEVATSEWATAHMVPNEANSYVLGRFVEADRANNNKQYFRLGDLLLAQPTITHAPLNVNHQSQPVGTFISSEMQYPVDDSDHPYIEALAAVWKHYFPTAYEAIQRAFAEGNLYYSMEAVPRTLSTIGGSDDAAEYAYEGRISPNYPREINERDCDIVLNSPHFVGGALIIPPSRPGWSHADVKQMSKFMHQQWETAEEIYSGVQTMAPHADPSTWEIIMGELILMGLRDMATAKVLKTSTRNALPDSAFAIPSKRAYPIHDLNHAKNALARVSQYGTPEEKSQVRSAVYRKYPQLKKSGQ